MKAIRFAHYGEPAQVLAVEERPLPELGPGEARVRILAPVRSTPRICCLYAASMRGGSPSFPLRSALKVWAAATLGLDRLE
jgi:hypothetical protein